MNTNPVDELSNGSTEPSCVTRFDMHHGRAVIAPDRQEAAFIQVIAQLRHGQGRHLQHVHAVERGQADPQGLAPEAVMVGGYVLFGETAGDQRLQVTMHLARRHLHVLGQARQRGARRQLGEGLEDVGADLGRADFLFGVAVAAARLFHGGNVIPGRMAVFIA